MSGGRSREPTRVRQSAITDRSPSTKRSIALIMVDNDYSEQLELQLAAARDRDDRDLMNLLISIMLIHKAQTINAELADELEKEERRLLYHESRKYASRASVCMPAQSGWTHMLNCGDDSDGLWVIWTGLSKHSFTMLRDLCFEYWENNPIRAF